MIRSLKRMLSRKSPKDGPGRAGHARTDPFFDCLTRTGYTTEHVIDVGAHRGGWTRTALRYFPDAHYSLFEPQAALLKDSDLRRNPRVHIHAMGAGPRTSTMKLTAHQRDDSFSFALSEVDATAQGRRQFDAPVVALDEFLAAQQLPRPGILKIDAEGWDLEVLRGAERIAAQADVILLEAAVRNPHFANTLDKVLHAMASRGFGLFDITDLNRTQTHNALWLVEAAFVREGGPIAKMIDRY